MAWRSVLQTWCEGIGTGAMSAVYDLARSRGETFAGTIIAAHTDKSFLPSAHRTRLSNGIGNVLIKLEALFPEENLEDQDTSEEMIKLLHPAATSIIPGPEDREAILLKLQQIAEAFAATSIGSLIRAIGVANDDLEQDLEQDKVNILTMHRAKGLTAEAVLVVAAEDEYIPGRAEGEAIDDERRLLYVSLTRPKHHLFVTYCDSRTGQQMHTGRNSGTATRSLSQFLVDSPHSPQDGRVFIQNLAKE